MSVAIVNKRIQFYVRFPKFGNSDGFDFSGEGDFLAVAERDKNRDRISVYGVDNLLRMTSVYSKKYTKCKSVSPRKRKT